MGKRNAAVELIPWEQIPEEVCRFFEREPDAVCRIKGKIYLQMDREALSCEDNEEGNKVLSAVQQRIRNHSGGTDPKDIWYQIITAPEPDRAAALAKEHGIEYRKKRTVVLFRVKYLPGQPLDRIFSEIAPLEEEDRLAAEDCDTLALIRESAFRSEDEIAEYAAAVIDTMVSEGVSDLQAGIGSEAEDLGGLHQSFEQARAALATGTRYYPNGTLFRYSGQKLERIIDAIPAEEREKLIREFRSGNIGETFDDADISQILSDN